MTYCPIKISMNRQRKNENYLNFQWKRQLLWIIHISVDNLSAWITQIIASFQSLWVNVLLTRKTITLAQITVWPVSDLQWTPTRALYEHPYSSVDACIILSIFTKCTQWQQSHSTWFKGFLGAVTTIAFHLVYLILIFLVIKKAWNVETLLFFTLASMCMYYHGLKRCLYSGSHWWRGLRKQTEKVISWQPPQNIKSQ